MNSIELVREYLAASAPGQKQFDRVRAMLTDDFTHTDTLMGATSADDFVSKIRGYAEGGGGPPMSLEIDEITGDDKIVAALTQLKIGPTTITYAQWFWIEDGKIQKAHVIYDPRPFLEMAQG